MIVRLSSIAIACLLVWSSAFGLSENYKPVRIELGGVFPMAFGDMNLYGFGAFLEPKLNITDNLSAGLRGEWNALFGAAIEDDGSKGSVGVRAISAYTLKTDYFFTDSKIRPFGGCGIGLYNVGGEVVSASADEKEPGGSLNAFAGKMFGIAPQLGINLGGFRLAITYNILIGKPQADIAVGNKNPKTTSTGYLAIDLAGSILSSKKR